MTTHTHNPLETNPFEHIVKFPENAKGFISPIDYHPTEAHTYEVVFGVRNTQGLFSAISLRAFPSIKAARKWLRKHNLSIKEAEVFEAVSHIHSHSATVIAFTTEVVLTSLL